MCIIGINSGDVQEDLSPKYPQRLVAEEALGASVRPELSHSRFEDKGQALHRTAKQNALLAARSTSTMFQNCQGGRRVKVNDKSFFYTPLKKSQCYVALGGNHMQGVEIWRSVRGS